MGHKATSAPADLDDDAKRLFRRLAGDLRAQRDGAEADLLLLADVLRMRRRLAQIRATLDQDGPTVDGSKQQIRPHPLLSVEAGLLRDIRAGFDQLRLSPAKRPGMVTVTAAGRLANEWDDEYDDE